MRSLSWRWKSSRGFSFHELLVAMALTGIGVLGYSASTISFARSNRDSADFTAAIHLAQDKMAQLRTQGSLDYLDNCPAAGESNLSAVGGGGGRFQRCWRIKDAPFGGNLRQIEVTVSWRAHENHSVVISSLAYVD